MIRALAEARDPAAFGGKAVQLGVGIGRVCPSRPGFAVSADHVEAVVCTDAEADADAVAALRAACVDGAVRAVRSSAIGEDSGAASFAGAHLTVLGVRGAAAVVDAVRKVHASGSTAGARAYRDRLGSRNGRAWRWWCRNSSTPTSPGCCSPATRYPERPSG